MVHMNTHLRLHRARRVEQLDQDAATVVSIVYVTASATFTGATAGFTTLTEGTSTTSPTTTAETKTTSSSNKKKTSTATADSTSATSTTDATTSTTAAAQSTSTSATSTIASSTSSAASATSTSNLSNDSSSTSSGLTTGGKIGIAIVIILLLVGLLMGALFMVKKKKQQRKAQERQDNEKSTAGFTQLRDINSQAPRLSLRPVTQFLPMLPKPAESTDLHNEKDVRPGTSSGANGANPFGNSAEYAATGAAMSQIPSPPRQMHQAPPSAAPAVMAGAAGAAMAAAPRSPPRAAPAGNVHRVQLDFMPSMEDELELRAGQVVRVLHEYDDGWALCVYMDRSKQGVAPRTCLSQHPLKPRPAGPPPGMAPLRAQSPAQQPQSPMRAYAGPPSASHNPLYPAPLSPSLPIMRAPQSPHAAGGRQRAYSQSQTSRPNTAGNAGPSGSPMRDHRRSVSMNQLGMPNRKPVPGGL